MIEPVHADSDLYVPNQTFLKDKMPTIEDYHHELMEAQISGKKWIEIDEDLMVLALREVSRAVGTDMSGHKSFMQNDVRVYQAGHKEIIDEKESRQS